jgi:hypothetical protein
MTAAELLNPRYEVINDYPYSKFKIGDILQKYDFENGNSIYTTNPELLFAGDNMINRITESMPHIFRKMNWWEGRTADQMPKKVKTMTLEKEEVYTIEYWDMINMIGWISKERSEVCSLRGWKPEYGYFPVD